MAEEKPINERVSVLETRADHHDNMLSTTFNTLVTQVERTNTILERFEDKLNVTSEKVQQWDTIARTLVKVTIVISMVIGGVWSLFEFVVDHRDAVRIVQMETK